jgi:hypothetical protein
MFGVWGIHFDAFAKSPHACVGDPIDDAAELPVDRTSWTFTEIALGAFPTTVEIDARQSDARPLTLEERASSCLAGGGGGIRTLGTGDTRTTVFEGEDR